MITMGSMQVKEQVKGQGVIKWAGGWELRDI